MVLRLSFYTGLRLFICNRLVTRGFRFLRWNRFLIAALPGPAGETGFGKKGPGHELFTRRFFVVGVPVVMKVAGRRLVSPNGVTKFRKNGQARKADERRQVGCFLMHFLLDSVDKN